MYKYNVRTYASNSFHFYKKGFNKIVLYTG